MSTSDGDPLPGNPPAHEHEHELEEILDVPYDRSVWTDAVDESLGTPVQHAP